MSLSGNSSGKISRSNENYFSIDDIIATQEKIPCKFEVAVPHLGKDPLFKLFILYHVCYPFQQQHMDGDNTLSSRHSYT